MVPWSRAEGAGARGHCPEGIVGKARWKAVSAGRRGSGPRPPGFELQEDGKVGGNLVVPEGLRSVLRDAGTQ